jgi:hypothetical protein
MLVFICPDWYKPPAEAAAEVVWVPTFSQAPQKFAHI